ncbi:MAG: hypothetical protein NVS3B19_04720 [Ginsengibacter sp.]
MNKLIFFIVVLLTNYTLAQSPNKVQLHYNRSIQSAGKVIVYGDSILENHTLDICKVEGTDLLAVEDRYGIGIVDSKKNKLISRWTFLNTEYKSLTSTYSGITSKIFNGKKLIFWGASDASGIRSSIMISEWSGTSLINISSIDIDKKAPAKLALPNQVIANIENAELFLYAVMNGNNELLKIRYTDKKIIWSSQTGAAPYGLKLIGNKVFVTNWAGPIPTDDGHETAGIPWGKVYTEPQTGATMEGSLSVFNATTGINESQIKLGFHPNAIISSVNNSKLYVTNSNNDVVSIIDVVKQKVIDSIQVGLFHNHLNLLGSSPNGLCLNPSGTMLYVANGLDNAIAVIQLGIKNKIVGFIPTEAYPSGLIIQDNKIFVTNLEATGSSVLYPTQDLMSARGVTTKAYTIHQELASLSIIPLPNKTILDQYTKKVKSLALFDRLATSQLPARKNRAPVAIPERIGEPSIFKHVIYIIKENKTYDQVFGDVAAGRGDKKLCAYGTNVTPNQHKLAAEFCLMDNYYASGKCSAEGHQWTDAAMVSDWVEKNVRSWFRSYPHRQEDALVYNKGGFIWNHVLDHGKKVKVYGEACLTQYDGKMSWSNIYNKYVNHTPLTFTNTTTIGRLRPIISSNYPDCDNINITDQIRADIFIKDIKEYEQLAGDQLPHLMLLSLPCDHTGGTSPSFPTPASMIADNDLALGRIVEAVSHSRFWDSTVIFVTEDDSQSGWDHISPYRTTGLIISPYTSRQKVIHTDYNQTSMVRTIEQILGLPAMNIIDITAEPMFDCFQKEKNNKPFTSEKNLIPLDDMNQPLSSLSGKKLFYAKQSILTLSKGVDGDDDNHFNAILWYAAKGDQPYPTNAHKK